MILKYCGSRYLSIMAILVIAYGVAESETRPDGPGKALGAKVGERIYWEGVGRDHEAFDVVVQGDVVSSSENYACVGCHRPSGFGSSEGGQFVPPITQPILFSEKRADRERRNRRFRDLFKQKQGSGFSARVRMPTLRPAYTEETLANAIRDGVDPAGRKLNDAMPRYRIDDANIGHLIDYLKTLSVQPDPGVDSEFVHLATIVSENSDIAKKTAVLDTTHKFVSWYNDFIKGKVEYSGFSPYYRSEFKDSYRNWKLHVWELKGPPEQWPRQLHDYYDRQPVFAVVGGIAEGPWSNIDDFCNALRLPCVFPSTPLPDTQGSSYGYTVYFSRGLELEGEAIASFIESRPEVPEKILQIRAASVSGRVPADAFLRTASETMPAVEVETVIARNVQEIRSVLENPGRIDSNTALLIWPGDWPRETIEALNRTSPDAGAIYLPSTALMAALETLSPALHERIRISYPYEKPTAYHPRQFRVRAWMHTHRVVKANPRIQLQTYYALTMVQFGLEHLVNDFYRDYLIEFIEHEAEAELNPGTHPELSLGPGQRFASKGAYIMKLDGEPGAGYKAVSDWIVPITVSGHGE